MNIKKNPGKVCWHLPNVFQCVRRPRQPHPTEPCMFKNDAMILYKYTSKWGLGNSVDPGCGWWCMVQKGERSKVRMHQAGECLSVMEDCLELWGNTVTAGGALVWIRESSNPPLTRSQSPPVHARAGFTVGLGWPPSEEQRTDGPGVNLL